MNRILLLCTLFALSTPGAHATASNWVIPATSPCNAMARGFFEDTGTNQGTVVALKPLVRFQMNRIPFAVAPSVPGNNINSPFAALPPYFGRQAQLATVYGATGIWAALAPLVNPGTPQGPASTDYQAQIFVETQTGTCITLYDPVVLPVVIHHDDLPRLLGG